MALKIRNADLLDKIFWGVSTPGNPLFHKYLTMDQLVELIAPTDAAIEAVSAWLAAAGIANPTMPLTRDLMTFQTTVTVAESPLDCMFSSFKHETGKQAVSSYGPYSVPSELAEYINMVVGVTGFPLLPREAPASPENYDK